MILMEFHATRNRSRGKADPDHLMEIIQAGKRWGFPQGYVDELRRWDLDHD